MDLETLQKNFRAIQLAQPQAPAKTKGRGGFLSSLISEAGGTGGALGGAAIGSALLPGIGTLAGALIGGFAGGTGGRLAENKIRDDEFRVGDALKEGVVSGIMGAGPIKLAKGVGYAGKAALAGKGLSTALQEGGEQATQSILKKAIGGKLESTAEGFAQKSLKLNNSKFNYMFKQRTGESVGAAARRFGITKLGPEAATETVYKPAAQAYSAAVESIGNIGKNDIMAAVRKETAKLANASLPESKQLGKEVMKRANELIKQYGDEIPALEVQKLKGELFDQIDKQITDKAGKYSNNIYDYLGRSFKTAINDAADKAGVNMASPELAKLGFKSKRLGDLGEELFSVSDLLEQAGVKAEVGGGTGFGSLRTLMAASAVPGGGAPALASAGIIQAANSPVGRKTIAGALDAAANRATAGAGQVAGMGPLRTAARVGVGGGLVRALDGDQSSLGNTMDSNTSANPNSIAPITDPSSQTGNDLASTGDIYPRENLIADMQRDPANAKKYLEYYNLLQEAVAGPETAKSKPLSSEAAKTQSNALAGIEAINDFQNAIASDPGAFQRTILPGRGLLGGYIGNVAGTAGIDAASQQIIDVIARLRTGAAISKDEEARFKQFIPRPGDSPQVREQKLGYLMRQFQRVAQDVTSGSQETDLATALLNAQ